MIKTKDRRQKVRWACKKKTKVNEQWIEETEKIKRWKRQKVGRKKEEEKENKKLWTMWTKK